MYIRQQYLDLAGGKLVVMYGGQNHDGTGAGMQQREVSPLHLDSLAWQPPLGVKTSDFINSHSAVTVARTKMMSYRSAAFLVICTLHLFDHIGFVCLHCYRKLLTCYGYALLFAILDMMLHERDGLLGLQGKIHQQV